MKRRSDKPDDWSTLREKIIGLGEKSIQKSYYPQLQQKLEESEFFRSLLDHSIDSIFLALVPTGELTDVNESACRRLGYTHGEMLQMTLLDLLSPAEAQQIRTVLTEHDPAEKDIQVTASLFKRNGDSIPVEITISLVKLRGSVHAVAVMRDITKRKVVEDALRTSESFLSSIIDQSPNPMWISDDKGTLVRINQACRDMLHVSDDEVLGKYNILKDNIVEEQGFLPMVKRVFEYGDTVRFEIGYDSSRLKGISMKKNVLLYLDVTMFPVLDAMGRIAHVVVQHQDITERKKTQVALIKSEEKFSKVFRGSPAAIAITRTKDDTLIDANEALEKLLGYSHNELIGHTTNELGIWADPKDREQLLNILAEKRSFKDRETRFRAKDGGVHITQYSADVVEIEGESCILSVLMDITKRKQAEESLKKSERIYRLLVDNATDMVSRHMPDSTIIYTTPSCQRMLGYKVEDMVGHPAGDFVVPEDMDGLWAAVRASQKAGEDRYRAEFRMIRRDGSVIWAETLGRFIYDEQHHVIEIHSVVRDITERKHAEEALRESEDKYRSLFENAIEGIFQTTLDGRIVMANTSLASILGFGSSQEAKEKVVDIGSQIYADPEERKSLVKDILHKGVVTGREIMFKRSDRSPIKVMLNFRLVKDKEGVPRYIEGSCIDITARWQAEEALKASEEKYRSIFENATEGIYQTTIDGRCLSVNPSFANMFGFSSPQEMINSVRDIAQELYVSPEDRERMVQILQEQDKIQGYEVELYRKDRSRFWISINIHTVRDASGNILYFEGTNIDITERKHAEMALRESEMHIREIINNAPFGAHSYELQDDGRLIFTGGNNAADRILNLDHSSLIGLSIEEAFAMLQTTAIPGIYREVARTGRHWEQEVVLCKDNSIAGTFEVFAFQTGTGRMTAFFHDITERKRAEETLREREVLLRATLNATADGLLVVNREGRISHMNRQFARMWRIPEHLQDTRDDEILLAFVIGQLENPDTFQSRVRELYQTAREDHDEVRFKDGRIFERYSCPMILEKEEIGRIWDFRDITKNKQAEEALRISEAKYRRLYDSMRDAFVRTSFDGTIVECNDAYVTMLGYDEDEIKNLTHQDITPDKWHTFEDKIIEKEVMTRGYSDIYEKEYRRKDGTIFPVELRVYLLLDDKGGPSGMWAIVRDITDRQRAQEAIEESEARYRLLAENASDIIFTMDTNLRFTYISPSVERIRGYTTEEAINQSVEEILTPASLKEAMRVFREEQEIEARESKELWRRRTLELEQIRKEGSTIWTETTLTLLRDDKERLTGFLGITRDITERRKAAEERIRLESQLSQAQKMESIGTLAGGIAHDFNNILSAIIGYSELAIEDLSEPEKLRHEISEVLKAGDRARDLVSQILTFSRKTDISYSPLALKTVIKESLKMMRSMIPTTIEIRQDISDSGLVLSDPTQINQIVMNLCTNAVHSMDKAGGMLEVSMKRVNLDQDAAGYLDVTPGTYLRLTISDTGHGMPPEVIERIFEPYFTTKEMGRGTGLGLSVVHGIVKSHKGAITCRSVPEKGTTFEIYLPVIESAMNAAAVSTKEPYPTGTERVLFIDDEATLADLTGKMLQRLGYTVTVKTNSVEAFESFRGNPDAFDLVITDMTMPTMTGEMIAQRIMEIRPDIPIILCTGYSEHISEERARGMGIREFLLKPVEMAKLANTIRKVLDEK